MKVALVPDSNLVVVLADASGCEVRTGRQIHDAKANHVIDLHARLSRRISLTINGEPPTGDCLLQLSRLRSASANTDPWFLHLPLRAGTPAAIVPIPAGDYFYRLNGDSVVGIVCGVITVPAEPRAMLAIEHPAPATPLSAVFPDADAAQVELTSFDGRSLDDLVAPDLRRFDLRAFRAREVIEHDAQRGILVDMRRCRFRRTYSFP